MGIPTSCWCSRNGDQKVQVLDYCNSRFIMPPTAAMDGWGGPPTVGDFDGDGRPGIFDGQPHERLRLSPDCLKVRRLQVHGARRRALWQSATGTNRRGRPVHRCSTSMAMASQRWCIAMRVGCAFTTDPMGKAVRDAGDIGHRAEEPVIADVDGDGHAENRRRFGQHAEQSLQDIAIGGRAGHAPPGRRLVFGVQRSARPLDAIASCGISTRITSPTSATIARCRCGRWTTGAAINNFSPKRAGASQPPLPDGPRQVGCLPMSVTALRLFRLSGQLCNRGVDALCRRTFRRRVLSGGDPRAAVQATAVHGAFPTIVPVGCR